MDLKTWLEYQGIPGQFADVKWGLYPATRKRCADILELARDLPANILLSGSCGNGKTSTCIAFMVAWYSLNQGPSKTAARFYRAEDLHASWKQFVEGKRFDPAKEISESPLLIIDDLGKGDITDTYKKWLDNVIDKRHMWERPTIISTNKTSHELRIMFSDAIISRICSGIIWKFEKRDYRMERAKVEIF